MPRDCFAGRNETFRVRVVSHWNHYERRINDFEELFVFKDLTAFSFRVFSWGCHLPKKGSLRDGAPSVLALSALTRSAKVEPFERALCASFLTRHAVAPDWQSCVGVVGR